MHNPLSGFAALISGDPTENTNNPNQRSAKWQELKTLLSKKPKRDRSFDDIVRSALRKTGNEYLFSFPHERFPHSCCEVACIRLGDQQSADGQIVYLYQENRDGRIEMAEPSSLGNGFTDFANSFVNVIEQLRDIARPVSQH